MTTASRADRDASRHQLKLLDRLYAPYDLAAALLPTGLFAGATAAVECPAVVGPGLEHEACSEACVLVGTGHQECSKTAKTRSK